MLSSVQVSPDMCHIGAISEQGNLLVFDVATLAKELRRVRDILYMCTSPISWPRSQVLKKLGCA